jgi:hypothetical protein
MGLFHWMFVFDVNIENPNRTMMRMRFGTPHDSGKRKAPVEE